MTESEKIVEQICFLENGKYSERKPYIKDYMYGDGVTFGDYTYNRDGYVCVVWKSTDIGEQPQYKGEPLSKVVPFTASAEQMVAILDNQNWIYW